MRPIILLGEHETEVGQWRGSDARFAELKQREEELAAYVPPPIHGTGIITAMEDEEPEPEPYMPATAILEVWVQWFGQLSLSWVGPTPTWDYEGDHWAYSLGLSSYDPRPVESYLKKGWLPGDRIYLEVEAPTFHTDYWGECDSDICCSEIAHVRHWTSDAARARLISQAIEPDPGPVKVTRALRHRLRHCWYLHWHAWDDGLAAEIYVRVPRPNHYDYHTTIFRADVSDREYRELRSKGTDSDGARVHRLWQAQEKTMQGHVRAKLLEVVQKACPDVTAEFLSSLPVKY